MSSRHDFASPKVRKRMSVRVHIESYKPTSCLDIVNDKDFQLPGLMNGNGSR